MKHRFLRHFMIIALCAALATGALRLAGPALADNEPPYTVTASGNTFTITRRDTSTAERISWRTVSISAIENVDYYRTCGTMNFAKDVATMTHTVTERDLSNLPLRYRYQTGTTRRYDFEITDEDGLTLASCAREISRAATQYPAEKIGPSGSDLIYIQFANLVNVYATGLDSKEFVDIPVTGDSYVKVTDAGYAQGVHTAPLDSLYAHVGLDQDYLEAIGDKVYAAAAFTMKEEEDGYQYIQILADNPDTFDPDDVDGTVAAPSASLYKACFELSGDTAITTTDYIQFFPHRYDYRDRKTSDLGPQWREFPTYNNFNQAGTWMHAQAFKDGYRADDAGALVLSPLTDSLNIRFDAVGKNEDDWYFKNLFVRAAVIDTTAPTLTPDNGCLVSVPGNVWCKGATVTVSLCFSEIVDNSHTTLHTTWGDLTFVQDGSLSNVAAWQGTITADPGVRLAITGLAGATQNQAGVISDCEGNSRALDAADLQRINARLDQTVTSPTEYSITCDLAGGSLSAANPAAYTYFTDAVKLNNPTRTGYEFLGWTGTGLGSAPVMSVTIPAGSRGDRNYTAHWALTQYPITYELAGGSVSNPASYTVESGTIALNNPTRDGYRFMGWTGTDLGDERVMSVTIPAGATGPRSYTANWQAIIYHIDFNLDGGSCDAFEVPSWYDGDQLPLTLSEPVREGYDFLGWTGTGLGDVPVTDVTLPQGSTGDRNYTAHWALANYSISYDLGSGAQVSPDNPTAYTILSEGFTLNNPTRAGFEFQGWTGTGLGDEPVTEVTVPFGATGPRSYTAHWLPITYCIDYELYGGAWDASAAPSVYDGSQLPITLSKPVREGYVFLGWTGTGLGDVPVTDVTLPQGSTGDRNYTAHWALANYPISYDLGSGAQVSPDNPTAYTILSEGFTLNNPTRAGFEFRGWTGTDLGDELVTEVTVPAGATGPRSYTAHWQTITYYIYYYLEDGEWDVFEAPSWYDGDQLPITLSKPVREGYLFAGWTGTGLGDKPVMDVTIPVGATGYRYYRANWVRMPENLSCFDPRSESSISFSDITMLASDSTEWTGSVAAWGCLTIGERVNVRGNVNLILMDDCDLTVTKGITVANGSSLNIFAQTPVYTADGDQPIGCLTITDPPEGFAGLGGEANTNAGEITILGGRVTVNAGSLGAAIGGATRGCADVTIYDGIITATSSDTGAAIGSGYYGCADVTIYDGIVTATSSDAGAAIGGGYASYVTSVDIKGGLVTAVAKDGAAIGTGSFSPANLWVGISGGSIDASTHGRGAAIGTGYDNYKASSAVITITGGDITALAAYGEAENPQSSASPGDTHGVTTYNPNSSAAVEYANKSNSAIGAGASTNATHAGVTINISGGTVTAIGENYAKGIGSKDDTVILSWISADAPNPCVTATGFADIVRLEKAFADKDHAGTIFHSAQLVPGSVLKDTTLVPCALPEYTVTVATEKEGEVDTYTVVSVGNVSYNDTLACAGETVEVKTSTYNNQLAGLTLSDGQETVALRYQPWTFGVAKASFTMPAADVTVTALFTDHPVFCPYGLVLPTAVRTIEANAFEGDSMIAAVDARSCESIGPGAFKNCPRLIQIRVAKECVIDPTAFDEGASVQIFAPSGGAAETSCAAALGSCTFIPEEDG